MAELSGITLVGSHFTLTVHLPSPSPPPLQIFLSFKSLHARIFLPQIPPKNVQSHSTNSIENSTP